MSSYDPHPLYKPEEEELVKDCLAAIKQKGYSVTVVGARTLYNQICKGVFGVGYPQVQLSGAYEIKSKKYKAILGLARFAYHIPRYRESGNYNDIVLVGRIMLKADHGHVYIREENLKDKLMELLQPVEVDFPNLRAFSNKYYVLCNDEQKLRAAVTPRLLRLLTKYDGLEVEIMGKSFICRFRKELTVEAAEEMAEMLMSFAQADESGN